jgi:hypothetical protein
MTVENLNIKLKANKSSGNMSYPDYSLTFRQSGSELEERKNSYSILSALKGRSDVLVEINSSLLILPVEQREAQTLGFLDIVRALGLDYRYRKVSSGIIQSFISALFGSKNSAAHEVLACVPDEIWSMPDFYQTIPIYGARFYVPGINESSGQLLDEMQQLPDSEKASKSKLIVFSAGFLGRMVITSKVLSEDNLRQMLGLVK